jgi:hypothetical protein
LVREIVIASNFKYLYL